MKVVMTFGSFDLVHKGHRYYLSTAKKYGDILITIVARSKTIQNIKGKTPLYTEKERVQDVKNLGISSIVKLGHYTDMLKCIKAYRPDVIVLGYDQNSFVNTLISFLDRHRSKIKIVVCKPYHSDIYKSSKLKSRNT